MLFIDENGEDSIDLDDFILNEYADEEKKEYYPKYLRIHINLDKYDFSHDDIRNVPSFEFDHRREGDNNFISYECKRPNNDRDAVIAFFKDRIKADYIVKLTYHMG